MMQWIWAGFFMVLALVLAVIGFLFGSTGAHTPPVLAAYAAPALLFALAAVLVLFWPARRKAFLAVAAVGSVAALGVVLLFNLSPTLRYREALAFWQARDRQLTAHFPATIPAAQGVALHADGQVPLGVAVLQLSVKASPAEMDALERQYAGLARLTSTGSADWAARQPGSSGDSRRSYAYPPVLFYSQDSPGPGPLPEDFQIHVLQFDGNGDLRTYAEGHACGLAISRKQGRVIYWASRWLIS